MSAKMVYKFRGGFGGDAEATYKALERIRKQHGGLQPSVIVEEAETDAALHPHFIWDDAEAAREQRLDTARKLPRAIVTIRDNQPARSAYVHVASVARGEGTYQRLDMLEPMTDPWMRAVEEAQSDLRSAQTRVDELLARARDTGKSDADIARLLLAVEALQTANQALQAFH